MRPGTFVLTAVILASITSGIAAEELPARLFTTIDGLPRDFTVRVKQDSRGFLWISTGDGLTRFDGFKFVTYTIDDGLPDRRVNDLLETRGGEYWLATSRGLARFNPRGTSNERGAGSADVRRPVDTPMFAVLNPEDTLESVSFNVLLEDDGGIWCGTARGLYRLEDTRGRPRLRAVALGPAPANVSQQGVIALLKDRQGAVWIATEGNGLYRVLTNGTIERFSTAQGLPPYSISALLEDREGYIWVGMRAGGGLYRLVRNPVSTQPVVDRSYRIKDGLPSDWITSLYQTHDGTMLVGSTGGVASFVASAPGSGRRFQPYFGRKDVCDRETWDLTEDRHGNVWVATTCGLAKLSRNGFTTFSAGDGLRHPAVNSILETLDGDLIVVTSPTEADGRALNRLEGSRFTSVLFPLPSSIRYHGWGWHQTVIQDHLGSWWVPTGANALFRFPHVQRLEDLRAQRPAAVYAMPAGPSPTEIFRVYEDRRGHIWAALDGGRTGLLRWDSESNVFRDVTAQTHAPPLTLFTAFAEDRGDDIWIGTSEDSGLLRYRQGQFTRFGKADGAPSGWLLWLHIDGSGRLWIASSIDGLVRVNDPAATRPEFVKYTTSSGLSSNNIRCITSDRSGRIYVGTGRGVDRLDPASGSVRHFTVADGLPKGIVEAAYRDRVGNLWFGSSFGLSRLVPADDTRSQPAIYITGLSIAGVPRRVSELGDTEVPSIALAAGQNNVSINYLGLGGDIGEGFQYQYKLGANASWSAPTSERSVNFAALAPNSYTFRVRALGADGQVSARPATLAFSIAPQLWMRWWFLAAAASGLALVVYAAHRYRIRRLLEVANVRTRIATDLHDDIGTNLTRIAVLSEVARQQTRSGPAVDRLDSIATISRESVSSMNDIVWAIDPEHDAVSELVRRMRQHVLEVFSSDDTDVVFDASGAEPNLKLDADLRRDFFLVFKEAVNNAARHARASRVAVACLYDGRRVSVRVADNGRGFNPADESEGHGLANMRQRAVDVGGSFEIQSQPGRGTTVTLTVPAARRPRPFSIRNFLTTRRGR